MKDAGEQYADYAMNGGDGAVNPYFDVRNGVASSTLEVHGDPNSLNGIMDASSGEQRYSGWRCRFKFKNVSDGLSKTLFYGEKYVNEERN